MSQRFIFGKWEEKIPLTVEKTEEILQRGAQVREQIANYPLDKTLRLLDLVGQKWTNPNDPHRKHITPKIIEKTHFSPEMIELAMDELGEIFNAKNLQQKMDAEWRSVPRTHGFKHEIGSTKLLKWQPLGSVLHVLSGNVFLVGPGSMIEGLLTGNVTLLKMSSDEQDFMPVFMESLIECEKELGYTDHVVSSSIALLDYRSSQKDIIATIKKHVDGIVIWGGEQAVQGYRNDVPARTRIVVFGPKLSLAFISKNAVKEKGPEQIAAALATDISVWDQNACTAPQVCFVESKEAAQAVFNCMQNAMKKMQAEIPAGVLNENQAAEIQKLRSVYEMASFRSGTRLLKSKEKLNYTIILDEFNDKLEPSPLHRTIRITPVKSPEEVFEKVNHFRSYVQTVGLADSPKDFIKYSTKFGKLGVLRITPLGKMNGGEIDDPHDGAYDLPQLMNLTVQSTPFPQGYRAFDIQPTAESQEILNAKLRKLFDRVKEIPEYKEILNGQTVNNTADLKKIGATDRDFISKTFASQANNPGFLSGGHVTKTGGTTGTPTYCYFNGQDWQKLKESAAECFYSCGLLPSDRVANCMLAGDLYGSFVSFNAVNQQLGMACFNLANAITADNLLDTWEKYRFNVIQAMPAFILPVLREAKSRNKDFQIEKFMFGGSPINPVDRQWLQEELGVKRVISIIGATESGQFGYQCEHNEGKNHHLVDDFNYIEILDDKDQPVADGEVGAIAITSLEKYSTPLIRYKIGDQARILTDHQCPCGRSSRIMEYLGRADNMMALATMNLNTKDIDNCLANYDATASQTRVTFKEDKTVLDIKFECTNPDQIDTKIVHQKLADTIPDLKETLNAGLLVVNLKALKTGEIPRDKRTGKLKKIIDERFK